MPAKAPELFDAVARPGGPAETLAPVSLQLELGGRLRNIGRPKHWFMAVAEGVKNAMDAIEEAYTKKGRTGWIEVVLERQGDLVSADSIKPVRNVVLRDNGVGFDSLNFGSFCKPDSLYKMSRGGKGVGRLVCIQAFRQLQVKSTFQENDTWQTRNFVFQQETPELAQSLGNGETDWITEVRLVGLREYFDALAAITFDSLLSWLTEHFLAALLEKPVWLESLVIKDGRASKDLTKLVKGGTAWSQQFTFKNYSFDALKRSANRIWFAWLREVASLTRIRVAWSTTFRIWKKFPTPKRMWCS